MSAPPHADPLVEEILDVFAAEARIERHRLQPETRADDLGLGSLDIALALFELEDRYDIQLPLPRAGAAPLTVGDMVQQVHDCILARRGAPMPGAAAVAAGAPHRQQRGLSS